MEAVITNIDAVNQRLSLSMKALQPDIWERFFRPITWAMWYPASSPRSWTSAPSWTLATAWEGLVHISELSDKHITNCAEVVEVGQSYPFKVIRLEPADKRIGLSLKEGQRRERQHREREDEPPRPQTVDGAARAWATSSISGDSRKGGG